MTTIFFSDGTYSSLLSTDYADQRRSGAWEIKDGKFVLTYLNMIVYNYSFSRNNKSLTLNCIDSYEIYNLTKQ
jgi:hypothetical protein